jgi:hypothetical protein
MTTLLDSLGDYTVLTLKNGYIRKWILFGCKYKIN